MCLHLLRSSWKSSHVQVEPDASMVTLYARGLVWDGTIQPRSVRLILEDRARMIPRLCLGSISRSPPLLLSVPLSTPFTFYSSSCVPNSLNSAAADSTDVLPCGGRHSA